MFTQTSIISPICTINPDGYSVMVRNGYSNMSILLLFMDVFNIAPPPVIPVLPVDAFNDEPVLKIFSNLIIVNSIYTKTKH